MLFDPKHDLNRLEARLRGAQKITADLISDVISQACVRFPAHATLAKARVNRLIQSGAWTDATLALLELELPQWKVRRLVQDGGEWLCTLSKHLELPLGLDEAVEATHEVLALAILTALLQARSTAASTTRATAVPQVRPSSGYAVCCDNFS